MMSPEPTPVLLGIRQENSPHMGRQFIADVTLVEEKTKKTGNQSCETSRGMISVRIRSCV